MKRYLLRVLIITAAALAMAPAWAAESGNPNPGVVVPVTATIDGRTYSQWGDLWYEWRISIPGPENPIFDVTGEYADTDQPSDQVFILADAWYVPGGTADRWVTIPRDRRLLLPVATASQGIFDWCLDSAGNCPAGLGGKDLRSYLRSCLRLCADHMTDLYATLDGQALQGLSQYRVESEEPFSCAYPENSLWTGYYPMPPQPGTLYDYMADGYYLVLYPLGPGQHTITYGAAISIVGLSYGVTYHLTVQ